jgi:GDP-D-mannose dehydratase
MSSEGKVALITGITGQDGSYLTEFLLGKGYTVRSSKGTFVRRRNCAMVADFHLASYAFVPPGTRDCAPLVLLQYRPY